MMPVKGRPELRLSIHPGLSWTGQTDELLMPSAPMPVHTKRTFAVPRVLILSLSLCLYVGAFAAPFDGSFEGFKIFFLGLVYCWLIPYTLPWWANVVYWVALGCLGGGKTSTAATCGLSAGALASSYVLREYEMIGSLAFQLWVGSMAVLGFGALLYPSPSSATERSAHS
jgi:hypothetical protein